MKQFSLMIFVCVNFFFCNNKEKKERDIYKNYALCLLLASELNSQTKGTGNVSSVGALACTLIHPDKNK